MMIDIVNRLSENVAEGLEAAGYPPLRRLLNEEDGRILVGDSHHFDQFLPPRIIFTPIKSSFVDYRETSRGTANVANNLTGYDAVSKAVIANPAFGTDKVTFEVRCWSIASEDEMDLAGKDFEYTQALYHQLLASCESLMGTNYGIGGGSWEKVSHGGRVGREFVFTLQVDMPLLKRIAPRDPDARMGLPFAPSGVGPKVTDSLTVGSGNSSPGCEEP